jgi:hypothetical protein
MKSPSFWAMILSLALTLIAPLYVTIVRIRRPSSLGKQRAALISMLCFIGGSHLFFQASYWNARASQNNLKEIYLKVQGSGPDSKDVQTKQFISMVESQIKISEAQVAFSSAERIKQIPNSMVAFMVYYPGLLCLGWVAGRLLPRKTDLDERLPERIPNQDRPSFLARLCMIVLLLVGAMGAVIAFFLTNGGGVSKMDVALLVLSPVGPLVAAITYYLFKGIPVGADRNFCCEVLLPSVFWSFFPVIAALLHVLIFKPVMLPLFSR